MRFLLLVITLLSGVYMASAESLTVVSYNVENLFHPSNDSITADEEWTPEGERHWSFTRYNRKVENIARVLTNIGEWEGVDIVGLQEIENAAVVKKLCYTLRPGEYDMVHYDSPDPRGIDVALIYKKSRVDTLKSEALRVKSEAFTTRDILYVCARIDKRDTVHFFVCHFPSQRGGTAESAWKREAAKETLQEAVDSICAIHPNAKIIVMGDMNSEDIRMSGLTDKKMKGDGTHKYQGQWSFLDHFYVSPSINEVSTARVYDAQWIQESDEKYLGLKPQRTYNGFTYQNGFSDHLPIILTVSF